MNPILVIILVLIALVILSGKSLGNMIVTGTEIVSDLTSEEIATAQAVYNTFKGESLLNLGSVSQAQKLAMIYKESGVFVRRGKLNKEIVGDAGHSVGYCQVSQPAITDVNNNLGTNYTKDQCLNDSQINLKVGFTYLDMCLKSALNQGAKNPVKLAFKKYNGGIDETETSVNIPATLYSNSAYRFYVYYKEVLS